MLSRRIISTYKKPAPAPPGGITYIGKDVITSVLDPGSGPVTVPAGADAIIICVCGHQSQKEGPVFFEQLNFDNGGTQDFIHIGTADYNSQVTSGMFIMPLNSSDWPGTGAATIYWKGPMAADNWWEGMILVASYWSGMHQTDPIRDSETQPVNGSQPTETSSLTGVIATDMTVAIGHSASDLIPDPAPVGYGQTSIEESLFNKYGIGVGYELGESAFRIENMSFGSCVWAAIKAA